MIPLAWALLLAASPPAAAGDDLVRDVAGGLFEGLRKGDPERAVAALEVRFNLPGKQRPALLRRLRLVLDSAGRLERWSVVNLRAMPGGDRWRRALVVSHHARKPVAWSLHLYRLADGRWSILEVAFDANAPAAFIRDRAEP